VFEQLKKWLRRVGQFVHLAARNQRLEDRRLLGRQNGRARASEEVHNDVFALA